MGSENKPTRTLIVGLTTATIGLIVLAMVFSKQIWSSMPLTVIVWTVIILVGAFAYVMAAKRRRMSVLEKKRPGAMVVDGISPKYMAAPVSSTKESRGKANAKNVTMAITPETVELWSTFKAKEPMRTIPNSPGMIVDTEVVNYGYRKDRDTGTRSAINYESLVIATRNGETIIIRPTKDIGGVLERVQGALN